MSISVTASSSITLCRKAKRPWTAIGTGQGTDGGPATGSARLCVSKYQPAEIICESEVLSQAERRRQTKWMELHFLYMTIVDQMRYGSIEKAFSSVPRVTCDEFVTSLVGEFRLRNMDRRLRRLYGTFAGAELNQVDVRDVIASAYIATNHRIIRDNIYAMLDGLFDIYCSPEPPYFAITRTDLLRMFWLPIISDMDMDAVTKMVTNWLPMRSRLSRTAFLRRMASETSNNEFGLVQGRNLAACFQRCAWRAMAQDLRLNVLFTAENKVMSKNEQRIMVHQDSKAMHLRRYQVCRHVWKRWIAYLRFAQSIHSCRLRAYLRRARSGMRRWHSDIQIIKHRNAQHIVARAMSVAHRKKRRLKQLKQFVHIMRSVRAFERKHSHRYIMAREGCGHLRGAWRSLQLRRAVTTWYDNVWTEQALEMADQHRRIQLCRKVFTVYVDYVRCKVDQRKMAEREEGMRRDALKVLQDAMDKADAELRAKERKEEEDAARKKQEEAEERAKQRYWIGQRALAERQAADRHKLAVLDLRRAKRARVDRRQLRQVFEQHFETRVKAIRDEAMADVESWFDPLTHQPTVKGRDIVQTAMKELSRAFYRPPRPGGEAIEVAMSDKSNIIFVFIEVMLNQQGLNLRELFDKFDQDKSGYMDHDEFKTFMESLPIQLSRQNIRDIIQKVDRDGDGQIEVEELDYAMRKAIDQLGVPGSPWKLYVDPAQGVMVLHNIVTNEKIYDYKMTESKLLQVCHDNMRASETRRRCADVVARKDQELWEMISTYYARVIQKCARQFLARRTCWRQYYKIALVLKAKREAKEARATELIRCMVLCKLARRQLRFLARISYEKVVDTDSGHPPTTYWFKHATGGSSWQRSPLLGRERDVDVTPDWSLHFRKGHPVYYHAESGQWLKRKPEGYHSCVRCKVNLAFRKCEAQACKGAMLCFPCYRAWHLLVPTVRAARGDHDGVLLGYVPCTKCTVRPADRTCKGCQTEMCQSCFARIHSSPLLSVHVFLPL